VPPRRRRISQNLARRVYCARAPGGRGSLCCGLHSSGVGQSTSACVSAWGHRGKPAYGTAVHAAVAAAKLSRITSDAPSQTWSGRGCWGGWINHGARAGAAARNDTNRAAHPETSRARSSATQVSLTFPRHESPTPTFSGMKPWSTAFSPSGSFRRTEEAQFMTTDARSAGTSMTGIQGVISSHEVAVVAP
jgi:hypothetical protein